MANGRRGGIDLPSSKDLDTIIRGDMLESARLTNDWAQKIGKALQRDLKAAQIRNIFGKVRQIEMNWSLGGSAAVAQRDLILLKPKLRYQSERKREVESLANLLIDAIDLVDARDEQDTREKFQRFVDFFEAILAYHKAEGGR